MRTTKRVLSILVAVMLFVTAFAGCGGASGSENAANGSAQTQTQTAKAESAAKASEPVLEYSVYTERYDLQGQSIVNNTNDVVTPEVEKMKNVKIKDVILPAANNTIPFKQRLNTFIAANNLPDVVCVNADTVAMAVNTGKFAELTSYIDNMPNLKKYFPDKYWKYTNVNGKKYSIPQVTVNPEDKTEWASDPYNPPVWKWSVWIREDLLKKAGYKFTPMKELAKATTDVGKLPTYDQLQLDPVVDTSAKFVEMLRKIKALDIKVGDKPLIPFSSTFWSLFVLGSMMDFGRWEVDSTGQVSGFLGCPDGKNYMKLLTDMYREGLLDKDIVSQKDEQIMEKVSSGRVAAGIWGGDILGVGIPNLQKLNPEYTVRFIPMPKDKPGYGFENVFIGGQMRFLINKDFKDIKRLTEFWDWLYSDEALELMTWGPESSGVWEKKDGKKVYKDPEVLNCIQGNILNKKGADYYGIGNFYSGFSSKLSYAAPTLDGINPFAPARSYPPKLDIYTVSKALCGKPTMDTQGKAALGDGGPNAEATNSWYWGKFANDQIAKLFITKTDSEFEKAWNDVYQDFLKYGKYNEAKADMEKWFSQNK